MHFKNKTNKKWIFLCVLLGSINLSQADTTLVLTNGSNTPSLSWQNKQLESALQKQGVQVQATNQLKVVIRTDQLFKFPSNTQLLDSKNEILAQTATLIKSYGDKMVSVSGHTDNVGSDTAKLKRSQDQANTVAAYLWSRGIPLKNISALGCGDSKPVSDNSTLEGSAANRRIEIMIE